MAGQPDSYYEEVLSQLGAPASASNLKLLQTWGRLEDVAPGYFNAFGIINQTTKAPARYADATAGADATASLLSRRYPKVTAALKQDNAEQALYEIVQSPWNVYHYGASVLATKRGYSGLYYDYKTSSLYRLYKQAGGQTTDTLNPPTYTASDIAPKSGNPLSDIADFFNKASKPELWRRTGLVLAGVVLVFIGGEIALTGSSGTLRKAGKLGFNLASPGGKAKLVTGAVKAAGGD